MKKATVKFISWLFASTFVVLPINVFAGSSAEVPSPQPTIQNEKNTNGFFPAAVKWFDDNSAGTVFQAEPVKSDSPTVGFYEERPRPKPADEELGEELMQPKHEKFDARNATQEDIVREFGDPDKDAPLNPIENAPTPFKGLMAALDSGNEALAQKYAKQYLRHIKNLRERSEKVTNITREVLSEEDPMSEVEPSVADETTPPVDPKGAVDVMFFFRPEEPASAAVIKEVNTLYKATEGNPNIQILGYSLAALDGEAMDLFKNLNKIQFSMQNGQVAANKLGIRISPTIIFVAKTLNKIYRVEDVKKPGYLTAVLQHMTSPMKQKLGGPQ